jgi:hypothetical protein
VGRGGGIVVAEVGGGLVEQGGVLGFGEEGVF